MSAPYAFQNFPNRQTANIREFHFDKLSDLSNWDWYGSGHVAPDALDDIDGGGVTLGSGSATSQAFIQGQKLGSSIKLNRTSKDFLFEWSVLLSSATLTQALTGICITNTNVLNTNITDGFGFFCNMPGGPGTGYWYAFNAFNSATQFTTYSQYQGKATDTSLHTLAVRIRTDASVTGAGSMAFFVDGVEMGPGFSNSATAILPHDEYLRETMAMGNGSAVAQTLGIRQVTSYDQI